MFLAYYKVHYHSMMRIAMGLGSIWRDDFSGWSAGADRDRQISAHDVHVHRFGSCADAAESDHRKQDLGR